MLDSTNAAMVDRAVANLRAAREPVYDPTDPVQAAAVARLRATSVEQPEPSPGERLVASVQRSYEAHRGRELTDEDRALCAEEARMKRLEDV